MKKCILLTAVLCLTLTACGGNSENSQAQEETSSLLLVESKPPVTTAPEESLAPTVSPVEGGLPLETEAPTETQTETTPETEPLSAPSVTKSPTDETVKQGDTALFVARAENADSVSWQFLPPDGTEAQAPDRILSAFPQLHLEGIQSETLTLKNIPMELDGWKVQARFQNQGGSVHSEAAAITVTQEEEEEPENPTGIDPRLYLPVIRNCQYIAGSDPATRTDQELAAYDPFHLADGEQLASGRLGYVLLDVDGDGAEELIIAQNNPSGQNYDDNLIVAMFGIHKNKPVKILQSSLESRYYLYADRKIYNDSAGDYGSNTIYLYTLKDCMLMAQECLWSNLFSEDGEISYYHAADGRMIENEENRITESQYSSLYAVMQTILSLPELTEIQ